MTVINTNLSAVAAQNSLRTSALNQTTAMERLSSGIRINSAKDDAAGLAISTRMTANIRGLSAAIRNANDGISLTQTAEGSLASIGDNLQRIRELAVQSANTGNNDSDRGALNTEARQLVSEIDRIANNSQFNGIKLLDGSFQNQSLQVGAGNDANDRIAISIGSAKVSALGIGSNSSYSRTLTAGGLVPTGALTAGSLSINGAQIGASVTDGVSYAFAEGSAISKAAAINAASGLTGVTAKVSATTITGNAAPAAGTGTTTGDVLINGVDIGPIGATTGKADRGTQVAAAINAKSSQTGVTATSDTTSGVVSLKAADGRNITVSTTTAGAAETGLTSITGSATTLTASAAITSTATVGFAAGTVAINGVDIGLVADQGSNGALLTAVKAAINGVSFKTGVIATFSGGATGNLILTSLNGKAINVTGNAAGTTGTIATSAAAVGSTTTADTNRTAGITLSTNSSTGIVIGGKAGADATGQSVGFSASVLSSSGGVDLSTAAGSQAALSVLDTAINTITDSRASMGAYQNRLTASVANLETTSMNLQASRSRILDTDYAKETTNLAKSQIIQQAATAMLAQANQSAQSVLSLLK
jgi:flagellin